MPLAPLEGTNDGELYDGTIQCFVPGLSVILIGNDLNVSEGIDRKLDLKVRCFSGPWFLLRLGSDG